MNNFTKVQRTAFAILIITGAIESSDLEPLGISKSQADAWVRALKDRKISFEEAYEACQNYDLDKSINYILAMCLDKRHYTKAPQNKSADIEK